MKTYPTRLLADYGGMLTAILCLLHCAAGPLLLAFWGVQHHENEAWEKVFLAVSSLLVVLATWHMSSVGLRWTLWGFCAVLAGAVLLSEQYPWLELVQYGAAVGLMSTHLLNLRYGRRCCS